MIKGSTQRGSGLSRRTVRAQPAEVHFGESLAQLDAQSSDWDREVRIAGALRRLVRDSSAIGYQQVCAVFGSAVADEATRRLPPSQVFPAHAEKVKSGRDVVDQVKPSAFDQAVAMVKEVSGAKIKVKPRGSQGRVSTTKPYPLDNALAIVKECTTAKFDESIDVAVQLGIDAKKSDRVVRGVVVTPNGTGKTKRVAVFAQGVKAEEARAAGADVVGMEDLAEQVKAGNLNFDVVIASPDTMRIVGTLGQILGPRGLMPNPKVGTVTPDVATAVRNAKAGQVQFRVDKAGIVHGTIGRRSFEAEKLVGNLRALIEALNSAKPASSKGVYLRKVAVSEREVQVLKLGVQGKSRSQVGSILGLSTRAVDGEARSAMEKLQIGIGTRKAG